jgi:hypothetical protein
MTLVNLEVALNRVQGMMASLEQYGRCLAMAGTDGINGQAAAILKVDLKRTDALLGTVSPLTAAVEDFNGSYDSASKTVAVDVKQLSERIKEGAARAKEIIAKIMAFLKEQLAKVIHLLRSSAGRVDQALQKITQLASGAQPSHSVIDVGFAGRLFIGDEYVGNHLRNERELVDFMLRAYPAQRDQQMNAAVQVLEQFDFTSNDFNAFKEQLTQACNQHPIDNPEIPWVGGVRFEILDGYRAAFVDAPDNAPEEYQAKVRSVGELSKFLKEAKLLNASLAQFEQPDRRFQAVLDKAHALESRGPGGDMNAAIQHMQAEVLLLDVLRQRGIPALNAVLSRVQYSINGKIALAEKELELYVVKE